MNAEADLSAILKAASFAAEKHRDQRRKDAEGSPYINHPIALANVLANEGGVTDPEVIVAALLHDTIEDTETTADELRELFGNAVTGVVLEVTDDKSLPKVERKRLQVEHAARASPQAKLVKLADKICNLRDILSSPPSDWSVERQQEYFDWSARVVAGVRDVHPGLALVFDRLLARRPGRDS
jgi:GTP diphosphokinase / guanosine-3',5'-bis(diphosphate) 3'-diphosphatase